MALLPEHFWAKVQKTNGCWNWTGKIDKNGYGRVYVDVHTQDAYVHRIAWLLTHGVVPTKLCVCHHCDHRSCCRPDHLFLGTDADNARDMFAKGRGQRGARQGQAKLTDAIILTIRSRYAAGGITQQALANEYGTIQQHISDIVHHKRWRHLT